MLDGNSDLDLSKPFLDVANSILVVRICFPDMETSFQDAGNTIPGM